MARKKILRSRELFTMKLDNTIQQRLTYKSLHEMKSREGLPEDVKKILAASESEVYAGLTRMESQIVSWTSEQIIGLLTDSRKFTMDVVVKVEVDGEVVESVEKKEYTFRDFISLAFEHDPQFKMVNGKLTEATYVEGEAEDDE